MQTSVIIYGCVLAELAGSTGSVSRQLALLGNSEENTALSRALAQLSEVEEKLDQLYLDQSDQDFYVLTELVKDYIGLVSSVKVQMTAAQCLSLY